MIPQWIVKGVQVLDDYKLLITFQYDEKKIYDMKPLLDYNIFKPLKNVALFKQAHTDGCTVIWTDEIDIDPECLYNEGISI